MSNWGLQALYNAFHLVWSGKILQVRPRSVGPNLGKVETEVSFKTWSENIKMKKQLKPQREQDERALSDKKFHSG